jgi:hypothetical protein
LAFVTFDEARVLGTTLVQLANGDMGRIVALDAERQTVIVTMAGGPSREIHVSRLIQGRWCVREVGT